jgi:hypothetical protein
VRKLSFVLSVVSVAVIVGACVGAPPPPPPPDPGPHRDVVLFGDSNGWGIGCYLGHEGIASATNSPLPCNPQPDFSTDNEALGACTIAGGQTLLYNRQVIAPSCANWRSSWPGILDERTPRLVVLSTGGWEISDRWINFPAGCNTANASTCAAPDYQWGSSNPNVQQATVARYEGELRDAIALFRSRGAKVLVTNSPYYDPHEAQVPGLADWWYERYPDDGGSGDPGGRADWIAPNVNLTYRPSERKTDQFNVAVKEVVDQAKIQNPAGTVEFFDLWDYTSPHSPTTNDDEYNDFSCGAGNFKAWPQSACPGSMIPQREPDHGHFTGDAYEQVIMPFMFQQVRGMLS